MCHSFSKSLIRIWKLAWNMPWGEDIALYVLIYEHESIYKNTYKNNNVNILMILTLANFFGHKTATRVTRRKSMRNLKCAVRRRLVHYVRNSSHTCTNPGNSCTEFSSSIVGIQSTLMTKYNLQLNNNRLAQQYCWRRHVQEQTTASQSDHRQDHKALAHKKTVELNCATKAPTCKQYTLSVWKATISPLTLRQQESNWSYTRQTNSNGYYGFQSSFFDKNFG